MAVATVDEVFSTITSRDEIEPSMYAVMLS